MHDTFTETQRTRLLFSIHGLSLRDELVIKSLVRLLDHRTHHHWTYSPENADLNIFGNAAEDVVSDSGSVATGKYVLRAGRIRQYPGPFLSLPVNSNQLELMLNDSGMRIAESKNSTQVSFDAAESTSEFRLLRWPPAVLLAEPGRMKIATVIMGRALSADALAQKAGVSVQDCISYLGVLQATGYLAVNAAGSGNAQGELVTPPPVKEKVAAGLLSRIRSRLGLTR